MTFFRFLGPLVIVTVLIATGCGSGSRQVQTVTISPTSANAQNFTNGLVSFVATGTFSRPPSPATLTSQQIVWCIGNTSGVCDPAIPDSPSVNPNGVTQCGSFVGTATVLAGIPKTGTYDAPVFATFGSAQLTCP